MSTVPAVLARGSEREPIPVRLDPAASEGFPESGWPNRECSRAVDVGGQRWHVQHAGQGPGLLLLHGTGSSTHSWRGLLPKLAESFAVVAPDLPGHGHTTVDPHRGSLNLPGMAAAVADLLDELHWAPAAVVGHSAGAAVALRMALDGRIAPQRILGLNAALLPFGGVLSTAFRPLAQLLVSTPALARLVASQARRPGTVERLIESTGSVLTPEGIEDYRRVLARPEHVAATLTMMAGWDLEPLLAELPGLQQPLTLVVGDGDRTISPRQAQRIRDRVPDCRIVRLAGLGHLAHEEAPDAVARVVLEVCAETLA